MTTETRVSVVTGGAAGIGLAAVERFARDGDRVVALDRDATALAELTARANDAGWDVSGIPLDVTDPAEVDQMGATVSEQYGAIDVLVCAAGIQRYGTVEQTDAALFNEVIGVNLGGVFSVCHTLMPLLRQGGGGSVVVVSSIQAYASQTGVAAYTATKGGLLSLVRAMAVDHAQHGVRVNAVCPGSVDTPMLRWAADEFGAGRSGDEVIAEWGRSHPLGRVARPSEVADAIAYLAGEQSSFITGTDLKVDGGVMAALGVALPDSETREA